MKDDNTSSNLEELQLATENDTHLAQHRGVMFPLQRHTDNFCRAKSPLPLISTRSRDKQLPMIANS